VGKLQNRVAVITGSSSGIGAAIVEGFAREGAHVVVNYPVASEQKAAEQVCEKAGAAGAKAVAICADVSDEGDVTNLAETAYQQFGHVDILVNNAGFGSVCPTHELETAIWDRMIAVHLRGTFLCTRAFLPGMQRQNYGRIINTASQLAYKGSPGCAHYTAAKAGILGFTRSLALELGEQNITANCVAPGATRTPMLDQATPEMLEQIRMTIPKGRLGEVEDIVPAYLYLASEDAGFVMGQCISPNGGDVFL
jgi:3-oxoacyl-[acyl-carrier protein] reductase